MGKKQRQAVSDRLAAIPRDEARVILATGKYVGEGFDDPRLDTLFLTLPVSWRGTIAQYAGRLHRLYDGKREVRVYDYADLNVPMLARMFDRRCRGYEAVGYTILLPASAIPGWPADVVTARPIRSGSATTPGASADSSATASTRRSRACSFTPLGRVSPDAEGVGAGAERDRGVPLPTAGNPARDQGAISAQRRAADPFDGQGQSGGRSVCAPTRASRWSWTARSISRIQWRTAGTDARISSFRRTTTSSCAFLPKTSARNSTWCSTPSCERSVAVVPLHRRGLSASCGNVHRESLPMPFRSVHQPMSVGWPTGLRCSATCFTLFICSEFVSRTRRRRDRGPNAQCNEVTCDFRQAKRLADRSASATLSGVHTTDNSAKQLILCVDG